MEKPIIQTNNIYHGDSYKLIKEIPDNSIDLIVTDPPYMVETQGAGFFGKNSDEHSMNYKDKKAYTYGGERYVMKEISNMSDGFSENILDELCRVMKKVNIYIWCSQKQLYQLINYFVIKKKCNWNLITWHKTNPIPACGNKYLSDTEYCLFFREKGVQIQGSFDTKFTYYVTPLNSKDKKQYGHPTIKPLDIIKNFIINSSNDGDIVFDPFMGSGTTCVAAKELGRKYIGFEINEKYYNIAKDRLNGFNQKGVMDLFTYDYEKGEDEND